MRFDTKQNNFNCDSYKNTNKQSKMMKDEFRFLFQFKSAYFFVIVKKIIQMKNVVHKKERYFHFKKCDPELTENHCIHFKDIF